MADEPKLKKMLSALDALKKLKPNNPNSAKLREEIIMDFSELSSPTKAKLLYNFEKKDFTSILTEYKKIITLYAEIKEHMNKPKDKKPA